jgi:hypothetical protein
MSNGLHNLPELQIKARQANHLMLYAQRAGQAVPSGPPSLSGSNSPT